VHLLDPEGSPFWQKRFRELNTTYFGGSLPEYRVYLCATMCEHRMPGQCLSKKREILIWKEMTYREMLAVLLHEMIHINILWHGPRFIKEWDRIRRMRAPISKMEGTRVRNEKIPVGHLRLNQRNARNVIEHWLEDRDPTRGHLFNYEREVDVMRYLASEFCKPQAVIRKKIKVTKVLNEAKRELECEARKMIP
jgi:hypothetical protein